MLAYVLHSRPYKETSALVDFLTEQGRLRAVLRGARGRLGGIARPFQALDLELRGRSELKSVQCLESNGIPYLLAGQALYSGLYLNELILRLLPSEDPHPELLASYALSIEALAQGRPLEPILRAFEWRLLDELGYGFSLEQDAHGQDLQREQLYRWWPERGFETVSQFQSGVFSGAELQALAQADWQQPGALAAAKRLMRQALAPHLGDRPLVSRELFMTLKEPVNG